MVTVKEDSGYLSLRGFSINVDFFLLEEIETILLRNIDLSNKYNRYKIELIPNKKNITKRYEFTNIENLKQNYKDIKNINSYDIDISLYTEDNDVDVKIFFKDPMAYEILSVNGKNVDLAYGKYHQLVNLLKSKKTYYWFLCTIPARIVIYFFVCYGIPTLMYCLKHTKLALIWLIFSVITMFFLPNISERIFPSRVIKLGQNASWYKNPTTLAWIGIVVTSMTIFVPFVLQLIRKISS